ncbi:TetR/AcrR family transcriptional regulator [Maricaulaceae bacterium MS644]
MSGEIHEEPGRRARKKRAVFESLYQAGLTLFCAHGYDAVSVSQICAEAGVAKGTFFNHFPTKEHLLFEWYGRATEEADGFDPPSGRLGDRLAAACAATLAPVLGEPELWRAKLRLSALHLELRAVEHAADARARARFEALMRSAKADREVRGEVDPDEAAALFLAVLTGTVREWVNAEGAFEIDRVIEARARGFVKLLA